MCLSWSKGAFGRGDKTAYGIRGREPAERNTHVPRDAARLPPWRRKLLSPFASSLELRR